MFPRSYTSPGSPGQPGAVTLSPVSSCHPLTTPSVAFTTIHAATADKYTMSSADKYTMSSLRHSGPSGTVGVSLCSCPDSVQAAFSGWAEEGNGGTQGSHRELLLGYDEWTGLTVHLRNQKRQRGQESIWNTVREHLGDRGKCVCVCV